MKKFIYILVDGAPNQETFNQLGELGWEFAWMYETLGDKTSVFKKEKT